MYFFLYIYLKPIARLPFKLGDVTVLGTMEIEGRKPVKVTRC